MVKRKRINVFISHRWEQHRQDYKDIINLFRKHNINVADFSVPKEKTLGNDLDTLVLERLLENRIRNCSIFIVTCDIHFADAEWVKMEIILATKYKKYILGIRPKGQKKTVDPEFLKIAKKGNGKIINYDPIRILQTIQDVTKFEVKRLAEGKRKNKHSKKQENKIRYLSQYFLPISIFLALILFSLLGVWNNSGIQENDKVTNDPIFRQKYEKIIIVQKITSLDSAIFIKKKYPKRNFEIIRVNADLKPAYYLSIINIKTPQLIEKTWKKIREKKPEWENAYVIKVAQICPNGIENTGSIYRCR